MSALRLDSVSRGPVNSQFSATVEGLLTIRAYKQEENMKNEFFRLVDENGRAFFTFISASHWISFYVELISMSFYFATVIGAYFLESLDPSEIALAITSSLTFIGLFQQFIRFTVDISSSLTSVQRMQEYTQIKREEDKFREA